MSEVRLYFNIFSYLNNKKPFRLTKNGIPNNMFKKVRKNGEEEALNINEKNNNSERFNTIKISLINAKKSYDKDGDDNIIEED